MLLLVGLPAVMFWILILKGSVGCSAAGAAAAICIGGGDLDNFCSCDFGSFWIRCFTLFLISLSMVTLGRLSSQPKTTNIATNRDGYVCYSEIRYIVKISICISGCLMYIIFTVTKICVIDAPRNGRGTAPHHVLPNVSLHDSQPRDWGIESTLIR